jgi:hypothetical protein
MAAVHPDPHDGWDYPGQTPDQEQSDGDPRRRDHTTSRRQVVNDGLDFVLNHDAELLLRLADA